MSRTEMFAVDPKGDVVKFASFGNAWGGAMAVWVLLGERYLSSRGPFHTHVHFEEVMALRDDDRLQWWEKEVLVSTFDNVIVPIEHVERLARAFEAFHARYFPVEEERGHAFTIGDQAVQLRRMIDMRVEHGWRGVCWNHTSVSRSPWHGKPEGDIHLRPYNVHRDDDHWYWPSQPSEDTPESPQSHALAQLLEAWPRLAEVVEGPSARRLRVGALMLDVLDTGDVAVSVDNLPPMDARMAGALALKIHKVFIEVLGERTPSGSV